MIKIQYKWERLGGPLKKHLPKGYIKIAQNKMTKMNIEIWSSSHIHRVANDKAKNTQVMEILMQIINENNLDL